MFKWGIDLISQTLFSFLSTISSESIEAPLALTELREKYGQENTSFNVGRSCYRQCDGKPMTCYYEFNAQNYDTMSGLCGACENGTISDCFQKGCIPANGVQRTIMTVNQQLPGPSINVCKNDHIIIDLTNHMPGQELTIHWHGLHQRGTPWFDGVPMVTQCPIFGGNTFRYIFDAEDFGTHLYHAHTGVHRLNGLIGTFIVRESEDPNADLYDYDLDEHSILLTDWNNQLAEEMMPGTKTEFLLPDSLLLNGFGTYTNSKTGEFKYAPIAAFYAERGKRHRFRIGNLAAHICPFELTIKWHNLTVIATDGSPIEPVVVDSVCSLAGERFDFVLNVPNDPDLNETIITVRATDGCKDFKTQEFARIIFVDDIHNYSPKAEDHEPLKDASSYESQDVPKISLNNQNTDCTNSSSFCIAAMRQKRIPGSNVENLRNVPAKVIELNYKIANITGRPTTYKTSGEFAQVSMINGIASTHSPVPGLIQDDSNVPYCNADNLPEYHDKDLQYDYPVHYCPHLIQLELGEVYELLLLDDEYARPDVSHSIHLHGFGFQVIDMGTRDQYISGQTAFANATHWPVIKDTVTMPSGGFVRVKFRANNPGYWFTHCHLEFHMEPGMTATIRVGNRSDIPPPPANFPTCGNFLTPFFDKWPKTNK